MAETNYDAVGRFIYGAYRNGGTGTDVENWMADDLGVARPTPGSHNVKSELYTAFFSKHTDTHELQLNYAQFIDSLKSRTL